MTPTEEITMSYCGRECYTIGGPWIEEDPDCPVHGYEAVRAQRQREELFERLDARLHRALATCPPEAAAEIRGALQDIDELRGHIGH